MNKVKELHMSRWVALMVISAIVAGCVTMDETFEEFTKMGETIYVGSSDTVLTAPGYNKLRFWVAINSDPKINKGVMESSDGAIKNEFDIVRTKSGKDTISFDLDLPEGDYNFGLFLLDSRGNRSVRREFQAKVYGDKYKSGLINRGISDIEAYETRAVLNWSDNPPNAIGTILSYEDGAGVMQTVQVSNEDTQTTIDDYKRGGKIVVTTTYKPAENAIELFEATPFQRFFPEEFLLDKAVITPLRLQGDATDGCYGSSYARLTDGSTSDYWHSCETDAPEDQYPLVMSFDVGMAFNLSRFRLDERAECCGGRSPAAYQIWATNDLTNAVTADIDAGTIDDWEADAVAKGWVKLLDVSGNDNPTFETEVPDIGNFRYFRIVGISAIDGDLVANFNEFTFWAR
jgi:hypothetical protein